MVYIYIYSKQLSSRANAGGFLVSFTDTNDTYTSHVESFTSPGIDARLKGQRET